MSSGVVDVRDEGIDAYVFNFTDSCGGHAAVILISIRYHSETGMPVNWTEALKAGAGESPGRDEAVSDAVAATAEKRRVKRELEELKMKKKKGR